MGKAKSTRPSENLLLLPPHTTASSAPLVDTHTHLASTFAAYRSRYKTGKYETVFDFIRGLYSGKNVQAIVDVWCEAPVQRIWKEFADSALTKEDRDSVWGGIEYWFVMGVHPHEAKFYNDKVENEIVEAMAHPRCVGWGEIGLDYHYDNSPREVQRQVFTRQVKQAVGLGKPLTIHTREADDDTEKILKEHVPKDHKIHIHCFTDTPTFAQRLLDHFPNLYIGITGVISYSTNANTSALVQQLAAQVSLPSDEGAPQSSNRLRILLETDAPYMVPANIYNSLPSLKGGKLPLCHTAMIPWTAEFVANVAGTAWNAERVMREARENARLVYSV
ncbi:hydrolase [Amanita muscaria]